VRYVQLALTEDDCAIIESTRTLLKSLGIEHAGDGEILHRLIKEGARSFAARGLDAGLPVGERRVSDLTANELSRFIGVADAETSRKIAARAKDQAAEALTDATQAFASVKHIVQVGCGAVFRSPTELREWTAGISNRFDAPGKVLHIMVAWADEPSAAANPKGVN